MEKNFDEYCGAKFDYFVDYYDNVYSEDFIKKVHDAKDANMKLTLINLETDRQRLSPLSHHRRIRQLHQYHTQRKR